jgi:hypothetical protein
VLAAVKRLVMIRIGALVERGARAIKIGEVVELLPRQPVADANEIPHRCDRENSQRQQSERMQTPAAHFATLAAFSHRLLHIAA